MTRFVQARMHSGAALEFDRLGFRYSAQETVLTDFSLRIPAGETVALVGHTGAGKSSLAKLIARFYEFQDGRLLIDGRDIRTFDLKAYRQQLGIVSQTPFLFAGTVADNIRYARPELSDAALEDKFRSLAEPVLGRTRSAELLRAAWTTGAATDLRALAALATP